MVALATPLEECTGDELLQHDLEWRALAVQAELAHVELIVVARARGIGGGQESCRAVGLHDVFLSETPRRHTYSGVLKTADRPISVEPDRGFGARSGNPDS